MRPELLAKLEDTGDRLRTINQRNDYTSSILMAEAAATIVESTKPQEIWNAPVGQPTVIAEKYAAAKERGLLYEATAAARRQAFAQALGEVAYRAFPVPEHQKAHFRSQILEESATFLSTIPEENWELSADGKKLLEDALSCEAVNLAETVAMVGTELANKTSRLSEQVDSISAEVYDRTVDAYRDARESAESIESQLQECAGGDPEYVEYHRQRIAKENPPSLLENIFIAVRRDLANKETQPDDEVVIAESVLIYTILETASAVGILGRDVRANLDHAIQMIAPTTK